ncbi:MAG TPA: class II aldolase/adducin family protein [Armatimonadota bacterium]|nr:class II aldolase/adducin family protein [Armatimonadota bacterium]
MPTDPRQMLVEVCHLLASQRFTSATGGNVSIKMPDGSFWVTPTSLHKARVGIDDLVHITASGEILDGVRNPSSETLVHLAVYRALPSAGAVIHAHPPAATGFAQAGKAIDTSCSSEAHVILGNEVPLIPYDRPSTQQLADLVGNSMKPRHRAYLMANHGVLTWGKDLWEAYDMLDTLEVFSQSVLNAMLVGGPVPLPQEETAWLEKKFITQ